MNSSEVILVDEHDKQIGTVDKMTAHLNGNLHRAFSIFIFNREGKMLLQRRALNKYHSGGLWTNACCSHPFPAEETSTAAARRLKEELGFETPVQKIFDFIYKTDLENGLSEYEFDHVFTGVYDGEMNCNKDEVMDISYLSMSAIKEALTSMPEKFTVWFRIAFPKVEEWWQLQFTTFIQK